MMKSRCYWNDLKSKCLLISADLKSCYCDVVQGATATLSWNNSRSGERVRCVNGGSGMTGGYDCTTPHVSQIEIFSVFSFLFRRLQCFE